jgi:hypothetical protein
MVEMPVWIISSGYVRSDGLIDAPGAARRVSRRSRKGHGSPEPRGAAAARARTLDVQVRLSKHGRPAVDGLAGAVEDAAEHVLGNGRLEHLRGAAVGARVSATQARCVRRREPRASPVNCTEVDLVSMPEVPSKTWRRGARV